LFSQTSFQLPFSTMVDSKAIFEFAGAHGEGDVRHADDAAEALADLVLADVVARRGERGGLLGAEDLPEMPAVDRGVGHG